MSGNTGNQQTCCTNNNIPQRLVYLSHKHLMYSTLRQYPQVAVWSLGNGCRHLGTTLDKHTVHNIVILIQMRSHPIPQSPLLCANQGTQLQAWPCQLHQHMGACWHRDMCAERRHEGGKRGQQRPTGRAASLQRKHVLQLMLLLRTEAKA